MLQLSSLLDPAGPSDQSSNYLVDMVSEAVTAVVYSMHDLASPQLVEIVLENTLKTHTPVRNMNLLGFACKIVIGTHDFLLLVAG